ncbi:MAG: serine protease [Flavobacteriales bacterium]|nr:serine protease [Flavobacteriales bacterium]|tara:strand:- start:27693 stop:29846 length:2154 start_codon:yes stop_codon:yes gene_type:complete
MKKISILIAGFMLAFAPVKADEGMWLPMLVKRLNYVDMQKQGLQLTPEEIYSVNNSSLKDAIVRLGRGFCTGEIISDQGLMLTNHHCGFGAIQELSTEENNYLDDGFWAMNKSEELPAGFSVSFLVRMEDVSETINAELNEEMSLQERTAKIRKLSDSLEKLAVGETHFEAQVKSFYNGNEFYLFVYETFQDVRLVGAPPSSVGKFGGDTDNWMWPRQTGDFTLFRVYADKDNKPAEYSEDNVPYTPKHSLPISLKGVKEGDFSMIFGYPGSTDRYLTSAGIKYELEVRQPSYVKLRREVLDIYEEEMAASDKVRLQYASKHASISNYWKYFKGQQAGLKRLKVYDKKKAKEDQLAEWIAADEERQKLYDGVLEGFETGFNNLREVNKVRIYLGESIFRIEAVPFARQFSGLKNLLEADEVDQTKVDETVESIKAMAKEHFKDYSKKIDQQVFAAMVRAYYNDLPEDKQPEEFRSLVEKYKGDYKKMAEKYYDKTIFASEADVMEFLEKPKAKTIDKDPIYNLMKVVFNHYLEHINPVIQSETEGLARSERLFVKGLREMDKDKTYAPDANSTMRFTYGQVKAYEPRDGISYHYYTTAQGILEKEDPTNHEFIVPEKLKDLILKKDYGQYANEEGELVVNFITNNDITGGNSGSPMINGNGELIGTAFDGNWEAMSGDIAFEHELQRTIGVDIRYTLFIIDKFAGASHLVEEMNLVK